MYSNKEAQSLIDDGAVQIDGEPVFENTVLVDTAEIRVQGAITRAKKELLYYKFNKPAGYESTMHADNVNNIASFFPEGSGLSIAGRLDKASEGLLLLSNDGPWVEKLCNPRFEKEKEYRVILDKEVDDAFIHQFTAGVVIGGYTTQPCACIKIYEREINVILREGKNRQIRRMCHKLGYSVIRLKRIRIAAVHLEELAEGQWERIDCGF